MMYNLHIGIGEHFFKIKTDSHRISEWILETFQKRMPDEDSREELTIHIDDGYGEPFKNFEVRVVVSGDVIHYHRSDYSISLDIKREESVVKVHDHYALKHALLNLYTAFIIERKWGLMLHASSMVDQGKAYVFVGSSMAGKSAVARLSSPRLILSDEAALLRIGHDGIRVYDSPFRSDTQSIFHPYSYPLGGIYLLRQSHLIERMPLNKPDSLLHLLNHLFYWAHSPEETYNVLQMGKSVVDQVPVYQLYFQENGRFWEQIQ